MMKKELSQGEQLKKELFLKPPDIFETLGEAGMNDASDFCEGYRLFLDAGKTEREAVEFSVRIAKNAGFQEFNPYKAPLSPGDKFYLVQKNKAVIFGVLGKDSLVDGISIVAAHIDSPRLDLKPNPVYEESALGFFKTHYYGGIKKYQWTALPLSLHGVVAKKDGTKIQVTVGENESEPVFTVTDLLPHLAADQMKKAMSDAITGEGLNVLIGSCPFKDDEVSEKIKLNILWILSKKYGIREEDFFSADLSLVPAHKARDVGLDKSMLGAYGQDDRVCAYTALKAVLDAKNPAKTAICLLLDREEIGSMGTTGMQSKFFEHFLHDLCEMYSVPYRKMAANSLCLSADVNAAFDPNYPEVYEKRNAAVLNGGAALSKYTGSRGKAGTSEASAELSAKVRQIFDKNSILWQSGELGKVDQGGGGTIAQFVANMDIDTIDCGVAVLSMHSPFEIVSKADVYMTYKAYRAFYEWAE